MNDHLLIGLSGQPRAGKDTVAGLLEAEFPGIQRVNYSRAIAEEYDSIHGTNTLNDEEEKVRHRHGFAALANQWRAQDPDFLNKRTLRHHDNGPLLAVGVRAVSEAEAVKARGGILIRVVVSEETLKSRMGEHFDDPAHHQAERFLDDYTGWDYVVHNDGTLEELAEEVKKVADSIRRR